MLERHDELIHHDILPRLEKVEKAQIDFNTQVETIANQVQEIKSSQTNLELTVMKDGQETRGILNKFVDHYFAADNARLETQRDVIHRDERITLKRFSTREKIVLGIVGAVAGSGGVLAGIAGLLQILK
ncbi:MULTISPECIES: hypothetical protein [unclassified Sporosarcina]|uniref:hypothetical protein n=1 Tax=unclassified Sporosarcina TaxID=2647733 RepID=UPI00203D138C|nr:MULTISPECIES: hypothetical protein [unclassified Sporosarcina]GKV64668.1 hypothetical protein NCCP2331_08210 [Sporosarcina sp. NCCP-2331]GLB54459.1 hypothetical protein NCCP2378_02440 [Sporosarcina sp. NCCP-2378]